MQTATTRYLFLTLLLLIGAGLYAVSGVSRDAGRMAWPESDAFYATSGWVISPQQTQFINGAEYVTRVLQRNANQPVTLTLITSQDPKLYGPGAEVPFLGNGYAVEAGPPGMSSAGDGVNSLLATGASDQWLVMYAYGEQRGLFGNGPLAWSWAVADGVLGRTNHYYRLFLTTRVDGVDSAHFTEVGDLARELFPRIAAWYRA
jgi:hypothetical protein